MKDKNIKFESITDKELLVKVIFYLAQLRSVLPVSCLKDHCVGAIAALFELVYYLDSHDMIDYGNNKK